MIERSEFIEAIEAWCRDDMATPGDRLLGALVTLRLLSSEVFKLLGPRSSRLRARQLHSLESLLAIIKGRIEEWESRWLQLADKGMYRASTLAEDKPADNIPRHNRYLPSFPDSVLWHPPSPTTVLAAPTRRTRPVGT
jgi:hypothetical protein